MPERLNKDFEKGFEQGYQKGARKGLIYTDTIIEIKKQGLIEMGIPNPTDLDVLREYQREHEQIMTDHIQGNSTNPYKGFDCGLLYCRINYLGEKIAKQQQTKDEEPLF